MGKKAKSKFIDKKRDVVHTFKLVARSQQDPLVADNKAPQFVLLDTDTKVDKKEEETYGVYFDDDYNYLKHLRGVQEAIDWEDCELEVYTVRKQDGKKENPKKKKRLQLPSSVFESYVEEPIGMLNKAAPFSGPRPELDPDIVAALDDDFEEGDLFDPEDENGLPDNFVEMLNADKPIDGLEEDAEWEDIGEEDEDSEMPPLEEVIEGVHYIPEVIKHGTYYDDDDDVDSQEKNYSDVNVSDDEEADELGSLNGQCQSFRDEETHSKFTNYSLTSSVLLRNKLLSQLDEQYEKFMNDYDDDKLGALDGEQVEGFVDGESVLVKQAIEQTLNQVKKPEDHFEEKCRIKNWIKKQMERCRNGEEEPEVIEVEVAEKNGEKWDCESIVSTYSACLTNHPTIIMETSSKEKIKIDPKTGIPLEHHNNKGSRLTKKALQTHNEAIASSSDDDEDDDDDNLDMRTLLTTISAISYRPPGETTEERRVRKKALRELRRERRLEKKVNREAFKEEKKRQEINQMNNRFNKKVAVV